MRIVSIILAALMVMVSSAFADNYVYQVGSMSATGTGTGTITQNGANWADVTGDGNIVEQYNYKDAWHDANGGSITQTLTNGAQVNGEGNFVQQWNDGYAYTDSSAVNAVITQTDSNLAFVGQNYYSYGNDVYQWNHEEADIIGSTDQTIAQDLANIGTVDGDENTLNQNTNWAKAVSDYDYMSTISQSQTSLGTIDGWYNYMEQNNDAYANTYYSDFGSVDQAQTNIGQQYGDWNILSQLNDADANSYYGYDNNGDGFGNVVDQDQVNVAQMSWYGADNGVTQYNYANADQTYGGWDETSIQSQSNFADTYDIYNTATQNNYAYSDMNGNGGDFVIQTQGNLANIYDWTWNGVADQLNYAYAQTDAQYYDDSDVITQTENNIAEITGYWDPVESAYQTNYVNAVQGFDTSVDITQTATNMAQINGP